jgi:hypothetical protein
MEVPWLVRRAAYQGNGKSRAGLVLTDEVATRKFKKGYE